MDNVNASSCIICSNSSNWFAKAKILEKYSIDYFKCTNCSLVQTETPYWLDEAYTDPINISDLGLVSRNITLSKITQAIIIAFANSRSSYVDYGGGNGLFVRLMRDAGFDFYHYDKFTSNQFARGFDADLNNNKKYDLLTAFELFEHFTNPLSEVNTMLQHSKTILFTTELIPTNSPQPEEWWYYGLEHGQHVTLYTLKSLEELARKLGLHLYSNGKSIHLLTDKRINKYLFKIFTRYKSAFIYSAITTKVNRTQSLLPNDYFVITGKKLDQ